MKLIDKIKSKLKESFYKGVKVPIYGISGDEEYTEIFINPNSSDIYDIERNSQFNTIRISTDGKGNIYAWKGEIIHYIMNKYIPSKQRFVYHTKTNTLMTAENMGTDWIKDMDDKTKKQLKLSFPKANKIESLSGKEELKL